MPVIDIFVFARQRVDNKGIGSRIKNSAKFHSLRSALSGKGSFASKGLALAASGVRSAFKLIPIPIIGDLLGAAEKAVEGKIRGYHRSKRLGQATTPEEKVKFALKDLSIENLDRYRWKLKEAITELNTKAQGFQALLDGKSADAKPCHAYLEMAEAVAQAERRFDKLDQACRLLIETLDQTRQWCSTQNVEITRFKNQYTTFFADKVREETDACARLDTIQQGQGQYIMNARHINCEHYCYYKEAAETDNWSNTRANLAMFVREVSAPFEAESFMSFDGSAFKKAPETPS